MKKFAEMVKNIDQEKLEDRAGFLLRILLLPAGFVVRIYHWVWDYDYRL